MLNLEKDRYQGIKAFMIARVSDPSQREALPAQTLRLEEYSKQNGFDAEFFSFDETAYKEDRQKFFEITKQISDYPKFCVVVFDKIDRFTRDGSAEIVGIFKNMVKDGKLELHFPSDGLVYHKNSPACDKTRLGIGMVFGEYYSAAISDNVKRKIEQKLHDGQWPGKAPIGYKNITLSEKEKTIIPDTERADKIVKTFNLRLEGKSYRTIAKIMKEDGLTNSTKLHKQVGQSQIAEILKNPFYYGVMKYNGRLYNHIYQPLIDKHLFDMAQSLNDENHSSKNKTGTKYKFAFNGILKCAVCGCSVSSYYAKGKTYLQCSRARGHCDNAHTSEDVLMPQVSKLLDSIQINENIVNKIIRELEDKHNNLQLYYQRAVDETRAEYDKIKKHNEILYIDRLDGRITTDEYDSYVSKNKVKLEELDARIVSLSNNDKSFVIDSSYLLKLASNIKNLFESSKPEQKNRILRLLLSNLKLDQKRLQFNLLEPFSELVEANKNQSWLRRLDSNQ